MKNDLSTLRHSASHVLASAVLEMFPDAKFAIGPSIDDGFYYDFDLPRTLIPEDLKIIESKMQAIIKKNLPFERAEIEKKEAISLFKKAKQPYKVELLEEIKDKKVSIYKTGSFVDLCTGPHIDSTGEIKAFKLLSIAGAYWRGDEKNKMLQRIYGTAFENRDELKKFVREKEEAKKYDHRILGKKLKLFAISEKVGKGLPLLLPYGANIRRSLERFIVNEELKRGYNHTYSPILGNVELYKMSGHWEHYKDSMYPPMKIEKEEYVLRPMTCPHQFMMYKNEKHSYKELPIKLAEISPMYRREQSGELTGLIRVMGFNLADAHVICEESQLKEEFAKVLDLIQYVLDSLGFEDYWFRASLHSKDKKKYLKGEELWEKSEKALLEILKESKKKYVVEKGEAAFYGPKLDVQIRNVNGKEDTIITNQIDLFSAERFDMTYIDKTGKEKRPILIHRSSIGCLERTMAFLLEKHKGKLPLWTSPIQTRILPVSEKLNDFAKEIKSKIDDALWEQNLEPRIEIDLGNETLGKKIRGAEQMFVPYTIIAGEKEKESNSVTLRIRDQKEQKNMKLDEFIKLLSKKIKTRDKIL